MSNELIKIESQVPSTVSNNASTEALFTARLQLLQPLSNVIKQWKPDENPGVEKPEAGVFWLGPPGGENLGKLMMAIPISWRDHALQMCGTDVTKESYRRPGKGKPPADHDEKIFLEIEGSNKTVEVNKKKYTNMWGKDVLFYIPSQQGKPVDKFAIFFFHSTARPAAEQANNNKGKMIQIKANFIETAQFSWYSPEIRPAVVPPDGMKNLKLPDPAETKAEIEKFLNPNPKGDRPAEEVGGRPR